MTSVLPRCVKAHDVRSFHPGQVMHGDCVVDERDGCGILSGDALLEALCLALRPELAVFLTDVPGVFSRPPSEQGAEVGLGLGPGPTLTLSLALTLNL